MDLERHVWSKILGIVEKMRKIDEGRIKGGGSVVPSILAFSYCPECDNLTACQAFMPLDINAVRQVFPLLVSEVLLKTKKCGECGGTNLPIGYAFSCESWMLNVEGRDEREIELFIRTVGKIAEHPKRKEIYLTIIVTIIGKKQLIKEIIREKGKVKLRRVKMPGAVDFIGRFTLPLPRINLNEAVKKSRPSI